LGFLLAACGDVKVRLGDQCGDDEQCGAGQICIDDRCVTGCRADADCAASGAGWRCVDNECVPEEGDPLLLRLSIGGAAPIVGPAGQVEAAVEEQTAGIALDVGGSVYAGLGEVAWAWRVTSAPEGVEPALTGTSSPRAELTTPRVFQDALVSIELAATYPEGRQAVTLRLTIRNNLNEPPEVTVTGPVEPVDGGAAVTLEADATDPNGEDIATPLTWEQTAGTTVTLVDATGDGSRWRVRFTAPILAQGEQLGFRVRVRDRHVPPAEAQQEVTVDVRAAVTSCADHDQCPAGGACTVGVCGPDGVCTTAPAQDGGACDDGDVCSTGDACAGGVCVGAAVDCDDQDPCTADSCAPATGCVHVAVAGCCRADGECDDGDACTADVCVPATGRCAHPALPGCCAVDADCDDGEVCTTDTCDATTGDCTHAPVPDCCRTAADCDDDDSCTTDRCDALTGVCRNATVAGCCRTAADCDDGDVCTTDTCDGATGACGHAPVANCCGTDADCEDGDPCTQDRCDPATGACSYPAVAGCCRGDADCDDDEVCTTDTCDVVTGVCANLEWPGCCRSDAECADTDPCTIDLCNRATGQCSHPAAPGCCVSNADCDDEDACTADVCDQTTGDCSHVERQGCCRSAADCDDRDVCTQDSCDAPTGACVHVEREGCCRGDGDCVDDDVCTADACDLPTGRCSNVVVPGCCRGDRECDDGNPCTADACDPSTRTCTYPAVPGCCRSDAECDDRDPCTADTCNQTTNTCAYRTVLNCCRENRDCADGNPCTADVCSANQCSNRARPFGTPCQPAGAAAPHGAVCDAAASCQPFTRDVYPDEPLIGAQESHHAFWLNDVYRQGNSGTAWAVGRQWYYKFMTVRAPISQERGVILSVEGSQLVERVFFAPRQGAFTGLHYGLAVGPAGVAAQDGTTWSDVTTTLGLSDSQVAAFQDVWGGPAAVLCCPRTWVVARQSGAPARIDRDAQGRWSWGTLSFSPTIRPPVSRVWGFAYDPDPFDAALDLRVLDTFVFADDGNARSVYYGAQPNPQLPLTPAAPGCDPAAGGACAAAATWRDAFGLRRGGANIVWGVGDAGTIQVRDDADDAGWQAVTLPANVLAGVPQAALDWTGVAAVRDHLFAVGRTTTCVGSCPANADQVASVVLLHAQAGAPTGLTVLDSYACSDTGAGGLRPCEQFPTALLRVGEPWVSEASDGLLDVWVVGGWPQLEGGDVRDLRAALWHVRLAL
jgi:hypothetical protein